MNDWWNDVTKGKTKYWEKKKLSQCHFVHNEFHMKWSGFVLEPSRQKAGN